MHVKCEIARRSHSMIQGPVLTHSNMDTTALRYWAKKGFGGDLLLLGQTSNGSSFCGSICFLQLLFSLGVPALDGITRFTCGHHVTYVQAGNCQFWASHTMIAVFFSNGKINIFIGSVPNQALQGLPTEFDHSSCETM